MRKGDRIADFLEGSQQRAQRILGDGPSVLLLNLLKHLGERDALDEPHGVINHAVGGDPEIVQGNDVGMLQLPRDARLGDETVDMLVGGLRPGEDDLDRHRALDAVVTRGKNRPHAALGDDAPQLVSRSRHGLLARCRIGCDVRETGRQKAGQGRRRGLMAGFEGLLQTRERRLLRGGVTGPTVFSLGSLTALKIGNGPGQTSRENPYSGLGDSPTALLTALGGWDSMGRGSVAGLNRSPPPLQLSTFPRPSPPRMPRDELHNRPRILQPMRVMPHARLADERDVAAQFLVTLGDEAGVLLPRHHVVRVAEDVQQRHLRFRQRREAVHGLPV